MIVREENWVGFGVVWVLVAVGHLSKFARVVVSSIFLDVLGLGTIVAFRVVSYKILKSVKLTELSSWMPSALFS